MARQRSDLQGGQAKPTPISRRNFLRTATLLPFAAIARPARSEPPSCTPHVWGDEGPFYPADAIPRRRDLTTGPSGQAQGQVLFLFGQVLGFDCQPLDGAVVEIWQADRNGQYRHPRAGDDNPLDPNFGYFGKVEAAPDGSYMFRTILPRWYNLMGIDRAAHIHFRVSHPDEGSLGGEIYFDDAESRERFAKDWVFQSRDPERRASLVRPIMKPMDFPELAIPKDDGAVCCQYDITFNWPGR
jgi:protocatechuate 3,4-dioxygenase beta subunit